MSLIGRPVTARMDSAAPPRASPSTTRQDDAGDADFFVEFGGNGDGVLAGHGVRHQQGLHRRCDAADFGDLVHQFLVDVQAAGGVQDQDVKALASCRLERALGNLHRLLALDDRQGRDARLLAQHAKLLLRRRAAGVERGEHDLLALAPLQMDADLGRRGRLARTLQADHQDHRRRFRGEVDRRRLAAKGVDEGVVDDLDDLLAGGDGAQHLLADRALPDLGDEVLDHRQRDIRLQQRHAHLAHGRVDVVFAQRAAAGQLVEDIAQLVGQTVEHRASVRACGGRRLPNGERARARTLADGRTPSGAGLQPDTDIAGKLWAHCGYVKEAHWAQMAQAKTGCYPCPRP